MPFSITAVQCCTEDIILYRAVTSMIQNVQTRNQVFAEGGEVRLSQTLIFFVRKMSRVGSVTDEQTGTTQSFQTFKDGGLSVEPPAVRGHWIGGRSPSGAGRVL